MTLKLNYASLPNKTGMPPGHAVVIRELVVPVIKNGKVVAILGVGNKPMDYTEKDVETVSYLADVTWQIFDSKRTAEALQKSERLFRNLLKTMLRSCLYSIRKQGKSLPQIKQQRSFTGGPKNNFEK